MHKILVSVLLVCLSIFLYAEANQSNQVRFGLISASEYNLDLRLSNEMQRVYITALFTVNADSLKARDYYSFFVNRDVHIEQVFVNAKIQSPFITSNLQPEHFVPVLPVPALLDSTSAMVCYSFKKADLAASDSVHFKVGFWIPLPEWQPDTTNALMAGFLTDHYWFPRNVVFHSKVNIRLQSSFLYKLELEKPCMATENKGIKTHRGCFQDGPGMSSFLKIIKTLN